MGGIEGNTSPDTCAIGTFEPGRLNRELERGIRSGLEHDEASEKYDAILGKSRKDCGILKYEVLEGLSKQARLLYLRHYKKLSPTQRNSINEVVKQVSGDMSQISSQAIFDIFSIPDKKLPSGIPIHRIKEHRVIREEDLNEMTVMDLYQISSRDGEVNSGAFLILSKNGSFSVGNPDSIKEKLSTLSKEERIGEIALNIVLQKSIPGFNVFTSLIQAGKYLDNKNVQRVSNGLNALFERN